jgi:ubiquinone/menaquinone biosynthesis C-methylase UbiE
MSPKELIKKYKIKQALEVAVGRAELNARLAKEEQDLTSEEVKLIDAMVKLVKQAATGARKLGTAQDRRYLRQAEFAIRIADIAGGEAKFWTTDHILFNPF